MSAYNHRSVPDVDRSGRTRAVAIVAREAYGIGRGNVLELPWWKRAFSFLADGPKSYVDLRKDEADRKNFYATDAETRTRFFFRRVDLRRSNLSASDTVIEVCGGGPEEKSRTFYVVTRAPAPAKVPTVSVPVSAPRVGSFRSSGVLSPSSFAKPASSQPTPAIDIIKPSVTKHSAAPKFYKEGEGFLGAAHSWGSSSSCSTHLDISSSAESGNLILCTGVNLSPQISPRVSLLIGAGASSRFKPVKKAAKPDTAPSIA